MQRKFGAYVIRGWTPEDAPSIAKYANNKKIWMNLRDIFPHPYSLQDAEGFISHAIKERSAYYFAIATPNEAIGSIGLVPGNDVHRYSAELGYWLAEPYWGNGITTQAVKIITEYAIQDLGMQRIFAEPYATNPASVKVLEKAGFIREGLLRSNVFKNGKILDQFIFSYIGEKSRQGNERLAGS